MSKTINVSVNFNFRAVFTQVELDQVAEAIKVARKRIQDPEASAESKGQAKALLDAEATGCMDTVLVVFIKAGIKDLRNEFVEEVKGVFDRVSPWYATYTPVHNKGPKVPATSINCIHCRVLDGAGRPYKCATCRSMEPSDSKQFNPEIPSSSAEREASSWDAGDV